jgi:hypothetical protein
MRTSSFGRFVPTRDIAETPIRSPCLQAGQASAIRRSPPCSRRFPTRTSSSAARRRRKIPRSPQPVPSFASRTASRSSPSSMANLPRTPPPTQAPAPCDIRGRSRPIGTRPSPLHCGMSGRPNLSLGSNPAIRRCRLKCPVCPRADMPGRLSARPSRGGLPKPHLPQASSNLQPRRSPPRQTASRVTSWVTADGRVRPGQRPGVEGFVLLRNLVR